MTCIETLATTVYNPSNPYAQPARCKPPRQDMRCKASSCNALHALQTAKTCIGLSNPRSVARFNKLTQQVVLVPPPFKESNYFLADRHDHRGDTQFLELSGTFHCLHVGGRREGPSMHTTIAEGGSWVRYAMDEAGLRQRQTQQTMTLSDTPKLAVISA